MFAIIFIIWCIGIIISLCVLFSWPKFIFKRFNEYRYPNHSRDLTKEDREFIDHHVKLIEKQQVVISKQKRPFIFGAASFVLLFFGVMAVLLTLFLFSPTLNDWLTDIITNRRYASSVLVDPFSSIWLFLIGIMVGPILISVLEVLAIKKNKRLATFNLLMPNYETKVGTEAFSEKLREIRKRKADDLAILIREGAIDSSKSYFFDELLQSLIVLQHRRVKRIGVSLTSFTLLCFILDIFNFDKVTNNEIIYSPAFSFEITYKDFDNVVGANYICVNEDNKRHLKLLIELDNGYKFRVRKHRIEKIDHMLDATNISFKNIDKANEWCQNLK